MQALWILFASAMFACMSLFAKFAIVEATLPQLVLFRGLPTLVVVLGWVIATRRSIIPPAWKLHVWRNVSGIGSIWLIFFAAGYLPLSTLVTLSYTSPLFIAGWMIATAGARDMVRMAAVGLGFVGVLFILRPTFDQSHLWPALVALTSGCLTAVAVMQVRSLGRIGEPEWRIVLYFSVAATATGSLGILLTGGWKPISMSTLSSLMGIGISGLLGQFAMTRAFSRGSAALCAVLQYTTIPYSVLLGFIFWRDVPDAMAWIGMLLIAAAGLLSTWRTMRLAAPAK